MTFPDTCFPLARAVLADPADDTLRKAYADWIEEHYPERRVRARYLREVRRHKFVRLVRQVGRRALYPEFAVPRGPRVDCYDYRTGDGRSPRFYYWLGRIRAGWRFPKWVAGAGYCTKAGYLGVTVREWIDLLSPEMR